MCIHVELILLCVFFQTLDQDQVEIFPDHITLDLENGKDRYK